MNEKKRRKVNGGGCLFFVSRGEKELEEVHVLLLLLMRPMCERVRVK